jgi:hypothetical protein
LTVFDKEKVAVGLANDAHNFYFCLKTLDRGTQMEIVRLGLTVWFDSTGGGNKSFGIHYPLGMRAQGMPFVRDRQESEGSPDMQHEFQKMLGEIEIVGPDNNVVERFSSFHSYGIQVSINDSSGALVYELRVPIGFGKDHPYAITSAQGSTFSIGLETGEIDRRSSQENRSAGDGEAPRGGRGGGGRGRGMGGGGRMPGNRSSNMLEPLHVWAKVHLSNSPSVINN